MQVFIADPVRQTILFGIVFFIIFFFTFKRKGNISTFSKDGTEELKGYAGLAILLSHIGYFLVSDQRFLFPLSIFGGLAVNVFFFFSGFGLTRSAIKEELSPYAFYKKRFVKIIVPFWCSLLILFLADKFILGITYPGAYVLKSIFGFFPSADLFSDVNSPFWYITPIIFFYILFPLIFRRAHPLRSGILLFLIAWGVTWFALPVLPGVAYLYSVHWAVFPLGVLCAGCVPFTRIEGYIVALKKIPRRILGIVSGGIFFYVAYAYSMVGTPYEQWVSIFLLILLFITFSFFKFHSFLVRWFGKYSFGNYLLHWPLIYRYGFWFPFMPVWIGSLVAVGLSLGVSYLFHVDTEYLMKKIRR